VEYNTTTNGDQGQLSWIYRQVKLILRLFK